VDTLFGGSLTAAASSLLGMSHKLDDHELEELERMVADARRRRR
jgi:hypothetical protein